MMLVPSSQSLPSHLLQHLSQLDEEMRKILPRTDLDESGEAIAYTQILNKYLKVGEKLHAPQQIKIVEDRSASSPTKRTK